MTSDLIKRAMSELGHRRAKKLSAMRRKEIASKGGRTSWAKMAPNERSAEMKRRAAKRKRNKARKAKVPK